MMQISSRIKQRHDTQSNWEANNIVLLNGELAIVDCGNQIRFKIGNGISSFNQLKYVDQNQLCTDWLTARAISQGTYAKSVPFGLAAGAFLCANANYSQALGYNAQTLSSDLYSFVWNGDTRKNVNHYYNPLCAEDYYNSHGVGSFNINPLSGLSGFYIGEQNLADLIDGSGSKIFINDRISGISGKNDLSVVKLSANEYAQMFIDGQLLSNCIYIVEDDIVNVCGQQIKNLAVGTDLSDAVTVAQLNNKANILDLSAYEPVSSLYNDVSSIVLSSAESEWVVVEDGGGWELCSGPYYIGEFDGWEAEFYKNGHGGPMNADGDENATRLTFYDSEDAIVIEKKQGANILGIVTYDYLSTELSTKQDKLTDAQLLAISEVSSKLTSSDITATYSNQHIYLSAQGQVVGNIDCGNFIKDGMLSSAELCGTTLVLKFNTDSGSDPISVELSNFVDDYDQKITDLCTSIDNKIFIENKISGITGYSDLSIISLQADEYASMLTAGTLLSNCIYIVENQFKNMYGQQIKNLAAPTDLSDATTKEYVDNAVGSIQLPTDLSAFTNSPGYLTQHQSLSNYYQKTETSSATQLQATLASIQKTAFAAINEPVATVNSIYNAMLSILNILKGN